MSIIEEKFKQIKLIPTDPQHPFYYLIFKDTLPPEEAYRIIHPSSNLVTKNLKEHKVKGYKRRFIFDAPESWTTFEKEFIVSLKKEMFKRHGVQMDKLKPFGPRNEKSVVIEGAVKPEDGIDMHLHDSTLLRFCVTRFWDFDKIIPDLYIHL